MASVVAVLQKRKEELAALQVLVNVQRAEEYTVDPGNLLTLDPRPIDAEEFGLDFV